jgi:hypothetical protein
MWKSERVLNAFSQSQPRRPKKYDRGKAKRSGQIERLNGTNDNSENARIAIDRSVGKVNARNSTRTLQMKCPRNYDC